MSTTRHIYDGLAAIAEYECGPATGQPSCCGTAGGGLASAMRPAMMHDAGADALPAALTTAGGIGGLLAMTITDPSLENPPDPPAAPPGPPAAPPGPPATTRNFGVLCDAMGNVVQLGDPNANSSWTAIAGQYEYDVYGNPIGPDADGDASFHEPNDLTPTARANRVRFSSKPFDAETGLGSWLYRYYSPKLGRWVSRDPIGELAGPNLHTFVRNMPAHAVDAVGLLQYVLDPATAIKLGLIPGAREPGIVQVARVPGAVIGGVVLVGGGVIVDILIETANETAAAATIEAASAAEAAELARALELARQIEREYGPGLDTPPWDEDDRIGKPKDRKDPRWRRCALLNKMKNRICSHKRNCDDLDHTDPAACEEAERRRKVGKACRDMRWYIGRICKEYIRDKSDQDAHLKEYERAQNLLEKCVEKLQCCQQHAAASAGPPE